MKLITMRYGVSVGKTIDEQFRLYHTFLP